MTSKSRFSKSRKITAESNDGAKLEGYRKKWRLLPTLIVNKTFSKAILSKGAKRLLRVRYNSGIEKILFYFGRGNEGPLGNTNDTNFCLLTVIWMLYITPNFVYENIYCIRHYNVGLTMYPSYWNKTGEN